jgi:hypothetical protein
MIVQKEGAMVKSDSHDDLPVNQAIEVSGGGGSADWVRPALTRFDALDASAGTGVGGDGGAHLS